MGLGSIAKEFAEEIVGYRFVPKTDLSRSFDEFLAFINGVHQELKIVAGELYTKIYNSAQVAVSFDRILRSGGEVHILAHLESDNPDGARRQLESKNDWLMYLKSKYGEKLGVWWAPERPRIHYGVADNKDLFVEDEHGQKEARDVWYFRGEREIASAWSRKFDELTQRENVARIL